jgi:hypothetical protein
LRTKRPPKTVSKPAETAEAAATLAGSAPAPAAKVAAKKAGPVAKAVPAPVVAEPLAAKPAKIHKPAHKPKLVRDSFTIPKDEYQVLESLKARALDLGQHARKSELLRAGIRALSTMNDRAFLKAIGAVPTLKTGRPKAD